MCRRTATIYKEEKKAKYLAMGTTWHKFKVSQMSEETKQRYKANHLRNSLKRTPILRNNPDWLKKYKERVK